ncbi:MAG TPA: hypothetical protein VLE27_03670 [Thermoanaerobaculia bacterium]|nr:hypothetical protein [Thermoanaerobaculia bacterium]
MRSTRLHSILPAIVAAAALFSFACASGEDDVAGDVTTHGETATQVAQAPLALGTPQVNELSNAPRTVDVQEDATVSDDEAAELEAQERELAARQADLEARERRLREQERERRAEARPGVREAEPAVEEVEVREERGRAEEARIARADPEPEPDPEPAAERLPALITTATIPTGTTMDVEFAETVASNTHSEGDTFRVRVTSDIREEGHLVIPAGSEILGQVTEAVPVQKKIGGRARLALAFTDLVLPSGTRVPIEASFVQQGRNETGRDAATIGGAAAGGAILGRVLNKGDRSKGGVIGAVIGAAAGAVIASRTPGQEVVFNEGTVVSLRLNDPVEVRVAAHQRRWE